MKLTIKATDKIIDVDGVECRLWEGETENGVSCYVFIHRIAVANDENQKQFERELTEKMPPRGLGRAIDIRMVLP